jgi:hypothetical protein
LTPRELEKNQRLLNASDHGIIFADHSSFSSLRGADESIGSDVSKSDVFGQKGSDCVFYS